MRSVSKTFSMSIFLNSFDGSVFERLLILFKILPCSEESEHIIKEVITLCELVKNCTYCHVNLNIEKPSKTASSTNHLSQSIKFLVVVIKFCFRIKSSLEKIFA